MKGKGRPSPVVGYGRPIIPDQSASYFSSWFPSSFPRSQASRPAFTKRQDFPTFRAGMIRDRPPFQAGGLSVDPKPDPPPICGEFDLYLPRLCGNLGHRSQKWFWELLSTSLTPRRFLQIVAKLSCGRHGSNHFGKKVIFLKLLASTPSEPRSLKAAEIKDLGLWPHNYGRRRLLIIKTMMAKPWACYWQRWRPGIIYSPANPRWRPPKASRRMKALGNGAEGHPRGHGSCNQGWGREVMRGVPEKPRNRPRKTPPTAIFCL